MSGEDFAEFHAQICEAAKIARQALDEEDLHRSVEYWQQLFGRRFPDAPPKRSDGSPNDGFTPRQGPSIVTGGRFA